MMHKDIENLIQKALDLEITEEEQQTLDLHLSGCPDCRKLYQEMVDTQTSLLQLPELYPGADFDDRVLRAIGFRKSFAWSKVWVGAAAAWLVSFLGFLLSPLSGLATDWFLSKTPALVRFGETFHTVANSFGRTVLPFLKDSVSSPYPFIGLTLSVFALYAFGRIITKEAACKESH
jgi:predicted anti-sigma-YlaC factor YlaD